MPRLRFILTLALTMACALAAAPSALASTASVQDGTLVFTGAPGEVNSFSWTEASYGRSVNDTAGITAGAGCVQREPTQVTCTGYSQIRADLGDGDDTYFDDPTTVATVNGGAGNDLINGGPQDDVLIGGPGNDTLDGDSDNDTIDGGPGNDILAGDDGDDTLDGGAGGDRINGDGPTNTTFGNDRITADDGEADAVDCSFGADLATVDSIDAVVDCESVTVAGGGDSPPPAPGTALQVGFSLRAQQTPGSFVYKGLRGRLQVSKAATLIVGVVVSRREAKRTGLGAKALVIASERAQAPEGGTFAFTVKPKAKYRAKLRRLKSLKVTLALIAQDADGMRDGAERTVTLRR